MALEGAETDPVSTLSTPTRKSVRGRLEAHLRFVSTPGESGFSRASGGRTVTAGAFTGDCLTAGCCPHENSQAVFPHGTIAEEYSSWVSTGSIPHVTTAGSILHETTAATIIPHEITARSIWHKCCRRGRDVMILESPGT